MRTLLFVARDADGSITGMYQPSVQDRLNYKMVYGIARSDAKAYGTRGTVEVTAIEE